jgi:uncharacterized membrane protein
MGMLIAGLALFLGLHSWRIVAPRLRDRLVRRLGEGLWKGLYALVALAGFGLVIAGFGAARAAPVPLYAPPAWLRSTAIVLLAAVFPMALAAYLPGRLRPALGHPLLAATALWSLSHLLANGRLADVVVFGSFLVWSLAAWRALARRGPGAARPSRPGYASDVLALAAGLALYGALLHGLHGRLFGVAPLG